MLCSAIQGLPSFTPAPGVRVHVLGGEKMTLAFFFMNKGALIPEHAHPHEQMGTVLKGSLRLVVSGEERIFGQGDAYHVPSGVTHRGEVLADGTEVLEAFSPAREDFAKQVRGAGA